MRSSKEAPCLTEAKSFLVALAPTSDHFTFQTFDDLQDRRDARFIRILHGSLSHNASMLCELNAHGAGTFVCVNETDLRGRSANNIRRVRAVCLAR